MNYILYTMDKIYEAYLRSRGFEEYRSSSMYRRFFRRVDMFAVDFFENDFYIKSRNFTGEVHISNLEELKKYVS